MRMVNAQYSNVQALNVTADDEVDYLMWLSQTARKNSLLVDLKNSDGLLVNSNGSPTKYQGQLVDAFDFNVIEQCVSHLTVQRENERSTDIKISVS